MTPLERAYLYGIGILTLMLGTTRGVNHWIGRLEQRYWEKQAGGQHGNPRSQRQRA